MIDPSELADELPNRPLSTDEVADICDQFGWSVMTEPYETMDGTEYVPRWFVFRPAEQSDGTMENRGDVLVMHMNEDMTEWHGELEGQGVTQQKWLNVCELYGAEMGMGIELGEMRMERADGTEVVRELNDGED